jgi:hypothetical protein
MPTHACCVRLRLACACAWPARALAARAGVAYVAAFTLLMNVLAYLALKFYSGQQPRASVSEWPRASAQATCLSLKLKLVTAVLHCMACTRTHTADAPWPLSIPAHNTHTHTHTHTHTRARASATAA